MTVLERDIARPRWAMPTLAALLVATAGAYALDLNREHWGNSFYAAAVQAGSVSWKAFLFGSSDAANSITVDKPPASLWIMELYVRIFGLNSWSLLLPQVLMAVLSVGIMYAIVARRFGYGAASIAGAVLATTPTFALMFRYDNPDALLTLTLLGAAWAMLHALEDGRTRWLVLTGAVVGLGFLTKQLQAFLVVPALAVTYAAFGPPRLGARLLQLLAAGAAVLVTAGWWVAIVQLVPAADRPWVGGSKTDSILDLTFGYNGLGRLTGNEHGGVAESFSGSAGPAGHGAQTGITRLFADAQGGQISWLIPAALVLVVAGIIMRGTAPRRDFARAWFVMWGLWLVGCSLVFSFMSGTFHSYYTIVIAPAIAAIVGAALRELWVRRERVWARVILALVSAVTTATSFVFLARTPDFVPWLRWVVLAAGVIVAVALLFRGSRQASMALGAVALAVALAGPVAYVADTVVTPHSGGGPSAGPSIPSEAAGSRTGVRDDNAGHSAHFTAQAPDDELTGLLESDAQHYTWVAATIGSNAAAGLQLATDDPVMPVGGFSGTDPSPTLDQFRADVAAGKIHYFIAGTDKDRPSAIADWVTATFTPETVGDYTVFDLSGCAACE
ncbi:MULTISPECIES: glycosyltransferase family 39 protein [unclassified Rhodococcus (in: high G+C Gram-positive bacteria)]|uniref:glycosyltransferase family 39 protein n=1 Tax=unclassified Rhodococcus (in: high G+C Gram-positive bacteria) TaxID=192944 RepID=UPI00211B718B|nr:MULTISPECIES: glycosyltransferase family 39 protein [unclassified Rhodococcus (in: high G+C Gram-positive bacteria)]